MVSTFFYLGYTSIIKLDKSTYDGRLKALNPWKVLDKMPNFLPPMIIKTGIRF